MMKLRHNFGFKDLGKRFRVSAITASRIFEKWIHTLYFFLKDIDGFFWKTQEEVRTSLPKSFQVPEFEDVRVSHFMGHSDSTSTRTGN